MKFIYITCNVSMLESLTALIDDLELTDYQVVEQVTAKSSYSTPRLNTAVWPSYNSSILIQEKDEQKVTDLINSINEKNSTAFNDTELIALYTWDITAQTQL